MLRVPSLRWLALPLAFAPFAAALAQETAEAPATEQTPATSAEAAEEPAAEPASDPVDPSGTWAWERRFGDNTARITLKLDWDGETLTGEHHSFGDPVAISDAKYEDGELTFAVKREFNGNAFQVDFTGKPTDDAIQGTISAAFRGEPRDWEWNAERYVDPADVVGVWKLQLETPNGDRFEPTLTVRQEGDALAADYSSQFGDREAKDVKIDGGKLQFEISGEGPRGPFKAVYSGAVRGDRIAGVNTFDFNGFTGEWEFTGARETPDEDAEGDHHHGEEEGEHHDHDHDEDHSS